MLYDDPDLYDAACLSSPVECASVGLPDHSSKRERVPMIKATAVVLVSILAAPSSALAQATAVDARQAAIVHVAVSRQSSGGLRHSIPREAAKLTEQAGTTSPQPQQPAQ